MYCISYEKTYSPINPYGSREVAEEEGELQVLSQPQQLQQWLPQRELERCSG